MCDSNHIPFRFYLLFVFFDGLYFFFITLLHKIILLLFVTGIPLRIPRISQLRHLTSVDKCQIRRLHESKLGQWVLSTQVTLAVPLFTKSHKISREEKRGTLSRHTSSMSNYNPSHCKKRISVALDVTILFNSTVFFVISVTVGLYGQRGRQMSSRHSDFHCYHRFTLDTCTHVTTSPSTPMLVIQGTLPSTSLRYSPEGPRRLRVTDLAFVAQARTGTLHFWELRPLRGTSVNTT